MHAGNGRLSRQLADQGPTQGVGISARDGAQPTCCTQRFRLDNLQFGKSPMIGSNPRGLPETTLTAPGWAASWCPRGLAFGTSNRLMPINPGSTRDLSSTCTCDRTFCSRLDFWWLRPVRARHLAHAWKLLHTFTGPQAQSNNLLNTGALASKKS